MATERIADHVKFAYWVPNVSGGLVTSDIEQRTDWNYEPGENGVLEGCGRHGDTLIGWTATAEEYLGELCSVEPA